MLPDDGTRLLGFVEINPALRKTIAERYAASRAFADLDAALAEAPDAGGHLHARAIARADGATIGRGRHPRAHREPLSTSLDGIDVLRRTVEQRQVVAGVAYVYRCHPLLKDMRAAIQSGRFGKPVELIAVSGQHFPTFRPAYREIYYKDRATGGGASGRGSHLINAGEWLVGPIDRLIVDAAHQVLDGVTVEDTVHLLARHGPVLASYSLNQHQRPNEIL